MKNFLKSMFLPNGVDHLVFNEAAPLQNPNFDKSNDIHIATYYQPSDYTFEIISEKELKRRKSERRKEILYRINKGYYEPSQDDFKREVDLKKEINYEKDFDFEKDFNFNHAKNIYLVKSDRDKKISRCLIFPDSHGDTKNSYQTISIERGDFSPEMEDAILQIPKRKLKKDQALLNGSRSAAFRKRAVLKIVEEQENDNKGIRKHYKEKNTGYGLYSWKSRYINHAFNVLIGQQSCFGNKYNLSIRNVTTTGIDGDKDKKITSNIMHIKNNNKDHNGKVMVIFVGNQQYPQDGLSLISSYFPDYKGDFIIADYSQFLLMKNEKYGDANINDLVNYGKTVLSYPQKLDCPQDREKFKKKNIETFGYSLGSYVAALSHRAAFPDSKEGENTIFLANALAHPAKFLDGFMFSWAGDLMRWILLSKDFRKADAGIAWKQIHAGKQESPGFIQQAKNFWSFLRGTYEPRPTSGDKIAYNTADDNVVNTGCSLYSSQETWWDYFKFWGRREDTSVHLLRHKSRSDMGLLKGNRSFNHAHVAGHEDLRQRADYKDGQVVPGSSAKDLIDNFATKEGEERKTKIPKKFYRRRWNKLSTFFWLPVKLVGTIFFLGVFTPIALALKYWKITALFLVAMAAMSVASIFYPALPLVLIAGLIGAKIFALSAVGVPLIANIRNIPGWLSKHPLRCVAALVIAALCFASVFFPALPVIFAVGALAAKCTAITTFAMGAAGFLGSIIAGIWRRCMPPKTEEVFHDEGKNIKISDDVHKNLLNNPQMKLSREESDNLKNDIAEDGQTKYSYTSSIIKNDGVYQNTSDINKYHHPQSTYGDDDIQSCSDSETYGC